MAGGRWHGALRPLAVYGLLLELYPRRYLRRHRAELLQNFRDLEQELPSKAALWRFVGKDLVVSLGAEHMRTLWGQTAIRFAILSVMLVIAQRYPAREHSIWTFCCGYALGWFTGWFGWHWRMSAGSGLPGFARSFRGQAVLLLGAIAIVLAAGTLFPDLQKRLVFAACYGTVIAWLSAWWRNHRYTSRHL
ncbi:MAG: hypothetical protein KGO22_06700 [Gammaproteobacteria bacterium]|nr:hypothetical protein [Gammaproteobacteria bacterium]